MARLEIVAHQAKADGHDRESGGRRDVDAEIVAQLHRRRDRRLVRAAARGHEDRREDDRGDGGALQRLPTSESVGETLERFVRWRIMRDERDVAE